MSRVTPRLAILSKYCLSTSQRHEGLRDACKALGIPFVDINVQLVRHGHDPVPLDVSIEALGSETRYPDQDATILKKLEDFQPSTILITHSEGLRFAVSHATQLRQLGATVGYWHVDWSPEVRANPLVSSIVDAMFLTNGGQLAAYEAQWGVPVHYMPQGYISFPPGYAALERERDVVFIGRRYGNKATYHDRIELIESIAAHCQLDERDDVLPCEYSDVVQRYKVALGVSMKNDVRLYASDRLFTLLGAGAFQLARYVPDLELLFENGKHLAWFTTTEEALEKIDYYLSHDAEREQIAKAGYELARDRHTYAHRLKNILGILDGTVAGFTGFLRS